MHRESAQSFDRLAGSYDRREQLDGDPVGDWLTTVRPARGRDAVDIGCGAGRHAVLLAEWFDRVTAVDPSEPMVRLAMRRRPAANVDYQMADLFDVAGSYDLVFSAATLHHVTELDAALVHIRSLLAPGGTVILADLVAPRRQLPRWTFRASALLRLGRDIAGRRPHARERFLLATEPAWLDHLASDRYLTRPEFDARYTRHFPGADIRAVGHLRVCVWQEPGSAVG